MNERNDLSFLILKPFHNLKKQKTNLLLWHFEFCLSKNEPVKKFIIDSTAIIIKVRGRISMCHSCKEKDV